jgi:hypothetical protein
MKHQLVKYHDDCHIIHAETGEFAGYVEPLKRGSGFSVHRTLTLGNETDRIATVGSVDEAISALTAYYEKNPPRWKRWRHARREHRAGYAMHTEFIKLSFYGVFTVNQQEDGQWMVTRCTDELLHNGQTAAFATAELARHVADLHERDGIADFPALNDGFSWDDRHG